MRIALKRPQLVLKEATRRIEAHAKEPGVQAHLLSIISDIIYPLLKKEEDFLIKIEKDSLQEDYLQGRMLGNPYKSSDAGMGPLMRDIKNKICRDCELVALLDDDTGMEVSEYFSTFCIIFISSKQCLLFILTSNLLCFAFQEGQMLLISLLKRSGGISFVFGVIALLLAATSKHMFLLPMTTSQTN